MSLLGSRESGEGRGREGPRRSKEREREEDTQKEEKRASFKVPFLQPTDTHTKTHLLSLSYRTRHRTAHIESTRQHQRLPPSLPFSLSFRRQHTPALCPALFLALSRVRALSHLSGLSDEHEMLRETCRKFADDMLVPNAAAWDKDHIYPADAVRHTRLKSDYRSPVSLSLSLSLSPRGFWLAALPPVLRPRRRGCRLPGLHCPAAASSRRPPPLPPARSLVTTLLARRRLFPSRLRLLSTLRRGERADGHVVGLLLRFRRRCASPLESVDVLFSIGLSRRFWAGV